MTTMTGLVIALPGLFFQYVLGRFAEYRYFLDRLERCAGSDCFAGRWWLDSGDHAMGRFRDNTDSGEETLIDMSPLIDCVFILLIFFIVTTTFVEETGVEVDKPQAASSVNLEKQRSSSP